MTENKDTITFDEFKAWLAGLIRGKRGALPDLDDWKQIKVMMDKVVPDVAPQPAPIYIKEIEREVPSPNSDPAPFYPYINPQPTWVDPRWPSDGVWCGGFDISTNVDTYGYATNSNGVTSYLTFNELNNVASPTVTLSTEEDTSDIADADKQLDEAISIMFTAQEAA